MSKCIALIIPVLLAILLGGCVDLPGSDQAAVNRYTLQGPQGNCTRGKQPMELSVVSVGSGLDNDRIASLDTQSGEISYLKGLRWSGSLGNMLEQRLAADLECSGFIVQTGHRSSLEHSQMLCEVRSLNLVTAASTHQAEVALSCIYRAPGITGERALVESARAPLDHWNSNQAMQGLSKAYQQVFASLVQQL